MPKDKNEGRFASLRTIHKQRQLGEEPLLDADDNVEQIAHAKTPPVDATPEVTPAPKKTQLTTATARRSKPSKPTKSATPEQAEEPKRAKPGRPPGGRRSNPDYTQITAYVPLDLYQDVQEELTRMKREQKTRSGINASELIETLLTDWLSSRKNKNAK
jgi:hypothetical protein